MGSEGRGRQTVTIVPFGEGKEAPLRPEVKGVPWPGRTPRRIDLTWTRPQIALQLR